MISNAIKSVTSPDERPEEDKKAFRKEDSVFQSKEGTPDRRRPGSPMRFDTGQPAVSQQSRPTNANALHEMLREQYKRPSRDIETAPKTGEPEVVVREGKKPAATQAPKKPSSKKSRIIKTLIGVALVAAVGWMPMNRLFQVSSVEAMVNARLITVRAPIGGVVEAGTANIDVGGSISEGAPLAVVTNPRADRYRLNDAIRDAADAKEERAGLVARRDSLETLRKGIAVQAEAFRKNRLTQVNRQVDQADARVASAEARLDDARAAQGRQTRLMDGGFVSKAALDKADSQVRIAEAALNESKASRESIVVERAAMLTGTFLGDDYNDQPRSVQRLDEIDESIATIDADIARQDARITRTQAALEREQTAYALVHQADLSAPVGGRVWEILTAPGEQVVAGQPLFSLMNCSQAIVTAVVSEAVYNSLSLGMPAKFIFREGGENLSGHVAQLSGIASASSNFAIMPSALQKESYRVAVQVDNTSQDNCLIGRTGRVVFGDAAR